MLQKPVSDLDRGILRIRRLSGVANQQGFNSLHPKILFFSHCFPTVLLQYPLTKSHI